MFRLKYAWATDKSFPYRGQEISIPGVASILQSIVSGGGVAQVSKTNLPNPSVSPVKSVTQSGEKKAAAAIARQEAIAGLQPLNQGAVAESVYINADPRLNAIIVHDLESKMPMYQELIDSLDKPTSQIEISVSIIDIDTDEINALGVDWNSGTVGTSEFSFTPLAEKLPAYSTIIQGSIGSFNARVNLLAQEGKLKVVSRPSILTLDNLEAVLDSSNTFYVSVASNEDAELFPVTAGTVVQVTPRIVREEISRRIHMNINIQDGTGSQVEGALPSVKNSSISTQAIVNESESLLVGGFYKETEDLFSTKVPVLGDLPILGGLFKSERTKKVRQVRLFLISPRIVGIESS